MEQCFSNIFKKPKATEHFMLSPSGPGGSIHLICWSDTQKKWIFVALPLAEGSVVAAETRAPLRGLPGYSNVFCSFVLLLHVFPSGGELRKQ